LYVNVIVLPLTVALEIVGGVESEPLVVTGWLYKLDAKLPLKSCNPPL
jgi:hypothetical protein